jgi:hypothetical protein
MKAKEYLKQAYRLDKIIASMVMELEGMKLTVDSVQSPSFGERVQTSRDNEARFVKKLYKIEEFEERLSGKIDHLLSLKNQISEVIGNIKNQDEQLVLRHRYLFGHTWEQISEELYADPTTIYRWHLKALKNVVLPDDIILINK